MPQRPKCPLPQGISAAAFGPSWPNPSARGPLERRRHGRGECLQRRVLVLPAHHGMGSRRTEAHVCVVLHIARERDRTRAPACTRRGSYGSRRQRQDSNAGTEGDGGSAGSGQFRRPDSLVPSCGRVVAPFNEEDSREVTQRFRVLACAWLASVRESLGSKQRTTTRKVRTHVKDPRKSPERVASTSETWTLTVRRCLRT